MHREYQAFASGFLLCALVAIIVYALFFKDKLVRLDNITERQAERQKIELREQGATSLYYPPNWDKEKDGQHFHYMVHSWNAGKTWYATEYDKDCEGGWGLRILGDADTLYPGLMEHILGMRQLTDYVEQNGSIRLDGTDPLGVDALENAGFEIKHNATQ